MKNKLQKITILLIYSGLFFLTKYFDGSINYLDFVLFTLGIILGMILMRLDEVLLHQYYLEPHATEINLMTRSLLFIFSLVPMGLFIVTSTGSELGIGLFLGIITILLFELVELSKNIDAFHSRFLFQLKRRLNVREINTFVTSFGGLTLVFILLTFFLGR